MKNLVFLIFLVATLLVFITGKTYSQTGIQVKKQPPVAGTLPKERIVLFTDRQLYSVNEKILFKADYSLNQNFNGNAWSTVLYLELIDQGGHPFAQEKYPMAVTGTNGYITIPQDLPTGEYFLKAYTKWMRNYPTKYYAYYPVKIINPFNANVNSSAGHEIKKAAQPAETMLAQTGFLCSTDKVKYSSRDKVEVSVRLKDNFRLKNQACMTVIKSIISEKKGIYLTEINDTVINDFNYFPEIRGISITGKIKDNQTDKPAENALVHLSMLNRQSYYSGFYTNNEGRFLFTFPHAEGPHDFYVGAVKEDLSLSVHLDPEFCQLPVILEPGQFKLTDSEKEVGAEICINKQIENAFEILSSVPSDSTRDYDVEKSGFYGDPVRTVFTKKYIMLPKLEEFIFELVPEFTIEYFRKVPLLKPSVATSFGAWPALVLIDNVPVTDLSKFLALPVEKIERLELIDKGYVSGEVRYNGIISAYSNNRDLAGIDLPKNSSFFNFSMYSVSGPPEFPDYSGMTIDTRIPDRRNTLYWNPDINLITGGEQKFSFYTADLKGEYEIIIRGLSQNGQEVIIGRSVFTVE